MKDHEKRELINAVRDTARQYAHTQQLRERLAKKIMPSLVALDVAMETLRQIESTPRNAGARRNARATLRFIETNLRPNA